MYVYIYKHERKQNIQGIGQDEVLISSDNFEKRQKF